MRLVLRAPLLVAALVTGLLPIGTVGSQPVTQPAPHRSDVVFNDGALPVMRITIAPADLAAILNPANQASDVEYRARFEFESPGLSEIVDSVGFRLRGNTSRASQKKSFRVSFNEFIPGRKFRGLEKLNLNGEHNDPSIMRAKLSWDLFRYAGVPASRANHVALWINGVYYGLMMNVEQVDEQFLQLWFLNDTGTLYKCLWPADLTYRGPTGASYRPGGWGQPYVLERGVDGYDDLARLISVINNTPDGSFRTELDKVLDVNGLLRAMAVIVATGSWDSYWFLKNNFYLYNDPVSGRFVFIPYDMDNSFGIWWSGIYPGIDWGTRNPYTWGHPVEARPLMRRVLAVAEYRERFTLYLKRIVHGASWAGLEARVGALRSLTDAAAESDLQRVIDYDFTVDDYRASFTTALAAMNPSKNQGHVTYGLLPFINQRRNTLFGQLDPAPIAPVISDVAVKPGSPRPSDILEVVARVEDEAVPAVVEIEYWLESETRQTAAMVLASDLGPDFWRGYVPALGRVGTTDVRIRAVDAGGAARQSSLVRVGVEWVRPPLYVNELLALNPGDLLDEFGDADDWIELHNAGLTAVSLAGFGLSDDPGDPMKWILPDVTVPAGGFLLVWADGEPAEGPLHAAFRLSGDGESVELTSPAGSMVDAVEFGIQQAGIAWARSNDGGPEWGAARSPTPGATNAGSVAIEPDSEGPERFDDGFSAWPNPFRDRVTFDVASDSPVRFEIFDLLGRRVASLDAPTGRVEWIVESNGSDLPAGVYFVRTDASRTVARILRIE